MKTSKKITIIVAVSLVIVGLLISFVAIAALDYDFTRMNTINFVTNTYSVDEDFTDISVNGAECDIRILSSNDGTCKIVCRESDKVSHSITVENDTLSVERYDTRKWYEHIGVYWGDIEIVVYLPQSTYGKLSAKNLSGDIKIPEVFSFSSADIQSTSGNVNFSAEVENDLTVKTVSGEVYIGKTAPQKLNVQSTSGDVTVEAVKAETSIKVKAVSGDIELTDAQCQSLTTDTTSGEVEFLNVIANENVRIESVSGDIELHKCDAQTLWLKTTSGNISGALLTEKIFFTDTLSGNVNVPKTASGGKCEIKTTSGDIEFE